MSFIRNHDYDYENGVVVAQPTVDKKGSTKYKCKNCTSTIVVEDIDKIPTIESVTLGTTTYTYTGSAFTPSVTVKAKVNGVLKTLTKDVDYTVSYSNNKNPGLATVTVTGKGKYAGTKTAQFTIKPAQVKNLKAEPGIEQITLSWDAVPGATGYAVYATAEEGDYVYIGATSKTSFVEKGLPNGTEFDYKVAAYVKTANGNVFGPYSNSIKEGSKIRLESVTLSRTSFVYTGEYIKPVATVKGYDVTGRLVVLTNWTDYKIDYKNFKAPGIATMTITGRGNYYGTLTINFTITPTWVQNVKQVVASTTDKEIGLTWDSVVGVTGYEVYRSTEKLGTYSLVGSTQTNSFVTKNLEAGKSYFYKVRAYKTVDGKRIYGNYSNILKATTRTVPPSKVMGAITMNTNNISWYYSPGAAGYEVYLSTASKFIGSKIETTTSAVRTVAIPGLTAGKYYYVRVRAYTTTATGAKMYTEFTTPLAFKAR